jgi:hypothetical protein
MPDNGAIYTGQATSGACPTCPETTTVRCGVETAEQTCSTQVCDSKYATLPKKKEGRILIRSGECLFDNNTVPTTSPQVWQRGLDGLDRLAPISSEMIPGKADSPCYNSVNQSEAETFGDMIIAQKDESTGKTCLNAVTLEDTDTGYLAGYAAEDVCSGTPKVRPIRLIPSELDGCSDNIRILAYADVSETLTPGLVRIRPELKSLRSIVLNTENVPSYEGDGDQGAGCLQPAAWINDGQCLSLARLKVASGVMGAWAICGGCLKFYELPKDGGGDYREDYVLAFVGGESCWQWQPSGMQDANQIILNTDQTTPRTIYALNSVPLGARFAHIALNNLLTWIASGDSFATQIIYAYYGRDQMLKVPVSTMLGEASVNCGNSGVVVVPIVGEAVALETSVVIGGASSIATTMTATVVGYS